MTSTSIPFLVALVVSTGIALAVVFANPQRSTNQCFLIVSICGAAWLLSLYGAFVAATPHGAELSIRYSFMAGALVLGSLNLLRLSIREKRWSRILRISWRWTLACAGIITVCATNFFMRGAVLNVLNGGSAPRPIYGPGIYLFIAFGVGGLVSLSISAARDLRRNVDDDRAELAFIIVGALVVLILTIGLAQVLGLFLDRALFLPWFAPLRAVLFSLVVAYGIATRKIMEVGFFLRRLMSYVVLCAYLLVFYGIIFWLVATVTTRSFPTLHVSVAHVIAALATTFAMAPARGFSQSFADRLFSGTRGIDFRTTVRKAAEILQSVTTLSDLLQRFAATIAEAAETDRICIFLMQRDEYVRKYPHPAIHLREPSRLLPTDPVVRALTKERQPLVLHELNRVRPTPLTEQVRNQLELLGAAVGMPILSREHLSGIMLLGPRHSGRIYGRDEQEALQVLCGQLGVAVDNAELFTEVQNAKLYNETLVQNLTTGVVAADTDGKITVFNHEAESITGLTRISRGRIVDDLPGPLRTIIRTTLATGERQEDREASFPVGEDDVYVRAGSAIFRGQERELLGALMVITDITTLKKMEQQIRRSDRLASLGTLSAGMAHEIKNPLVSIKTFAQLLPERYAESDFRETFSGLIVHEINRIDSLVNQLLRFARPTKPLLRPMHVHEILEKTLLLLQHRLYQKEIKVVRSWTASTDMIRADSDQLEQVFLNFFLNAMDAMKRGGELTVGTKIRAGDPLISQLSVNGTQVEEALCISIGDTGDGIKPADIAHVFDPFFTTKDHGTGLGLSVVHGIVQEHGGVIEVESELSKGTTFIIYLPLAREAQEVVAA